jgi:hypothetical protein
MDSDSIHIPSLIIPVIESNLACHGIQALLGRDVLEYGVLIYDGLHRSMTLAF